MAIRPTVLASAKVTAAENTHTNNVTDPKPMTGDLDLKNNQQNTQELMVDPDHTPGVNDNGCIYTHDNNDKDVKAEKGSSAAQRDKHPGKVKANADEGTGPGPTTADGGETPAQKMNPDPEHTINISTIPNDVNPLDGYPLKDNCSPGVLSEEGAKSVESSTPQETGLENNQQGEQQLDVEASAVQANEGGPGATTNQGAGTPQNVAPLVAEEEEEEWEEDSTGSDPLANPPVDPAAAPAPAPAPVAPAPLPMPAPVAPVAPVVDPLAVPAPAPVAPAPAAPIVPPAPVVPAPVPLGLDDGEAFEGEDVMSILDADGCGDDNFNDMAFAQMGASLHVLKANAQGELRVIASMTKEQAVTANAADEYTSDEFQSVTLAECKRYGLRAGLESVGFVLAEVNVGRKETVNARVQHHVEAATADVRKSFADKDTTFGHCLALASVGVNRGFFNDIPNELRAALTNQLTAAGLRNADRVVAQAFAQYGTGYAKAIITMATRLSELEESGRNSIAAALDMVNPEGNFEDPMDDSAITASVDEQEDEEFREYQAPASVTAALSFAGQPSRDRGVLLTPRQTGYSVTAAAFLNSDELLF